MLRPLPTPQVGLISETADNEEEENSDIIGEFAK
jgi:hypothetical protein